MKKTPQILLCLSVVGVVLLALAPAAHANCTLTSQIVSHQIGGFLTNCVEPATGRITLISDPVGTVSNFQAGHANAGMPMVTICNADAANGGATDAPAQPCQAAAGTVGDGNITVNFDWGAGSVAEGCPNPAGGPTGTTPIAIDVVDAAGHHVTLTTGFSVIFAGFIAENAHINDGSDAPVPIDCQSAGGGNISLTSTTDVATSRLVSINVKTPDRAAGVWCDCDTSAMGTNFADNSCGTRACGTDRGQVYSRIGPCSDLTNAAAMDVSQWTLEGSPDPAGDFTVVTTIADLEPNCLIGPNFCLSPPSAVGAACTSNADCVRDDCQFIGATNALGPVVAGTCNPPFCDVTDLGICTEFAPGFVRCSGDLNVICTMPGTTTECVSGSCSIGGASCTQNSECSGVCLTGNTDAPCTVDTDCDSAPSSTVIGDGILAIGGPAAASDTAVARLAELGKNVLKVEFSVSLEENARSFDIIAGGRVINDSPILAENRGSYVASIDKAGGKLKGAKEITVRTNLDGGGSIMSAPVSIKKGK